MKNKRGFTIVEILAVIVIIAILGTAAGIGVISTMQKQRQKLAYAAETTIADASVSYYANKGNIYIKACIRDGMYVTISQKAVEDVNKYLRETKFPGETDNQLYQSVKNFSISGNSDPSSREEVNNIINVTDPACYNTITVGELIEKGLLSDPDGMCNKSSLVIVYRRADAKNTAGVLDSVQEEGICKSNRKQNRGPVITITPHSDLKLSTSKQIKIDITTETTNLKPSFTLKYAWSKSKSKKPKNSDWQDLNFTDNETKKASASLDVNNLNDTRYLWVKSVDEIDDNNNKISNTIAGPYAFLSAPDCTITINSTPSKGSWYNSDVSLTLSTSGGPAEQFGIGDTPDPINNKTEYTVTTEGTNTYYGYVKNAAGRKSCSVSVSLDKTAPTISSVNYKYRASTFLSNTGDSCQVIPNDSCSFNKNDGVLELTDASKAGCLSTLRNQKRNGCVTKYNTKTLTKEHDSDYIYELISVNNGSSEIGLVADSIVTSDNIGTPTVSVYTGNYNPTNSNQTANDNYTMGTVLVADATNHGKVFRIVAEDEAGNSTTWYLVAGHYGSNEVDINASGCTGALCRMNMYMPYDDTIQNATYKTGWQKRYLIRTYYTTSQKLDSEINAYSFWSYYSDDTHKIMYNGKDMCPNKGCQLHGWYQIGSYLYFLNTGEFNVTTRAPDGAMVINVSSGEDYEVCNDSIQLLANNGDSSKCSSFVKITCNSWGQCTKG